MLQQILAAAIIAAFIIRLAWQKKRGSISGLEFYIWISFWSISLTAVIFLKQIDTLVARMGFSSSGINFLLYIAVVALFYFIFKLRIRIERQDRIITKIVRQVALMDQFKEKNSNQ